VKPHHNPDGMIALCAECHAFADQGKFTPNQLQQLKLTPNSSLRKFGWQRNELIVFAGGFYVNPKIYLRLKGKNIVWFNRDMGGDLLLNVDIREANGNPILQINNNYLKEYDAIEDIDDIEIAPHGQRLTFKAPALDVFFSIAFENHDQTSLRKLGNKWNMGLDLHQGPQEPVGALSGLSQKQLKDTLLRYKEGPERDTILSQIWANNFVNQGLTRWDFLIRLIQHWPVTVCRVEARLKYPFDVDIHSGSEIVREWKAGHTIDSNSDIVWDIG
jgi:hypothetical protein